MKNKINHRILQLEAEFDSITDALSIHHKHFSNVERISLQIRKQIIEQVISELQKLNT